MVYGRAVAVAFIFIVAVPACHNDKLAIVRIAVFQDYISVDGVRSNLPIQQAIDEQPRNQKPLVVLVPQGPLTIERRSELNRAAESLHPGIGIRQVQMECPQSEGSTCR